MIRIFLAMVCFAGPAFCEDALQRLKEGNERFIKGEGNCVQLSEKDRKSMAKGQNPFAVIVACADSRVAPEIIFDQGPGELFVVRLAGNVVDTYALASIEFALSVLGADYILVLGHEDCGAVRSAFLLQDENFTPAITALLKTIEPAVIKAKEQNPKASQSELLDSATALNAIQTKNEIRQKLQEASKGISIDAGVFHIKSGKVVIE